MEVWLLEEIRDKRPELEAIEASEQQLYDKVELPTKFSKGGGGGVLKRCQIFRGGCWERRGDLFQGVAVFT